MSLEKIMSTHIVSVKMDDTLALVQQLFNETNFHHLLVLENKKVVGMISDRDLLQTLSPTLGTINESVKDKALLNKKVHQIMARQPITLLSNASVYEAIAIFNRDKISCIPIVNENNNAKGVLSWRDIFYFLEQKHNEAQL